MATITNLTSGIEIDFGGSVTYIKHGNVKLLKRGTNINIYDDSDDDGNQRGQVYISIPFSEVTSPSEANIDALYATVRGYIDVSSSGGGTDANAVHVNVGGEINGITAKATPTSSDILLIEDAADSNNKKKITIADLPATSDANAVHVNASNEITAITEKTSIDNQDEFIIEDSEDSGNKKSVKRKAIIDPIVNSTASTATLTIDADNTDIETLTAQNGSCTIAAPTGTPVNGQKLIIRIKDDGSAAPLSWNAIFRAIGVTLPSTTTSSKIIYVGCIYNGVDSKWDAIAVKEEA
jgi:hypothetical protein|tara:strand:+ start:52 stop:933 length:882 start_codon:yes stop_codon:yes gene_type:complete